MFNANLIKAITLDLDDTLWPVWPTIYKAEDLMREFLQPHAPKTVDFFANKASSLLVIYLYLKTFLSKFLKTLFTIISDLP